jgi:WD40 repeat protein
VIDSWGKTATHRIQADSILNDEYLVVTTEEKVIVKNFMTKKNIKEYNEKILFTSSISTNGLIAFYKENESKDDKTPKENKISQSKQPAGFEIRESLTWRNKCSKLVKKGINRIEISKSGKYLIMHEYENKISLWDVEKCTDIFTVSLEDSNRVHGLDFDANEKYFIVSYMNFSPPISKALVFNIKTEHLFREFKLGNGYCPALAISPDERFLATGCDNRIQLWDWKTLQKLFSLGVDQSGVFELIFTKDSKGLFIRTAVARFFYWDLTKEEFYKTE